MSPVMEESEKSEKPKYRTLRDELAKRVSVSGLGYTIGTAVTFPRRTIWGLVVISAVIWVVILIQARVRYLLSFPTVTNTVIKTEAKLAFPAVTVCNQNMLSSSKVFNAKSERSSPTLVEALGVYFESMKSKHEDNSSETVFKNDKEELRLKFGDLLNNYDVTTLYEQLSTEKEKFIHKCSWMEEERSCSSDDFEKSFTDLGLCYTFNGNTTTTRFTRKEGSQGGLSLTLFIEYFDYFLHGERGIAGAMIYIHDQAESPAHVSHNGISVPVEFKTQIGLQATQMKYLPTPYGQCAESTMTEMPIGTPYSMTNCKLNCLTKYIKSKCGCVDSYMPRTGDTRYCNLMERTECVVHAVDIFKAREMITSCDCPLQCTSKSFVHYVSFANTAKHDSTNRAINHRNSDTSAYKEALRIQDWIILNAINTSYTDTIANVSLGIIQLYDTKILGLNKSAEKILNYLQLSENASGIADSQLRDKLVGDIQGWRKFQIKVVGTLFLQAFPCLQNMSCKNGPEDIDAFLASIVNGQPSSFTYLKFNGVQLVDKAWGFLSMVVTSNDRVISQVEQAGKSMHTQDGDFWKAVIKLLLSCNSKIEEIIHDLKYIQDALTNLAKTIEPYGLWTYKKDDDQIEKYTSTYFKTNFLQVDVYFQDLIMQYISQEESYSVEALFSDIGGSIGLCLGGSILTIVEIADVLMTWWAARKQGKQGGAKYKTDEKPMDEHIKQSVHM